MPCLGHLSKPEQRSGINLLTGVAAIPSNDVWAVGSGGSNLGLVLHWNGSKWSVSPTPQVSGQMNVGAVAALSSDDVWAVGSVVSGPNGTLTTLTMHWDGSVWSIVPSPNVTGLNSGLNAVVAIAPNGVWAVGNTTNAKFIDGTLAMHWDGSTWTIVSTPNVGSFSNDLYGAAAASTNDVWAVGTANGGTLAEHWNGSSWSSVTTPSGSQLGVQLSAVTVLASIDVWAVGGVQGPPNANNPSSTLVEHWTGSAWAVVPSPNVLNNNDLYGVAAVPGTRQLWAVGLTSNGKISSGHSLIEEWNGSNWTVSAGVDAAGSDAGLSAVAAVGSDVWAVGTTNSNLDNLTLIERHYAPHPQVGILCA